MNEALAVTTQIPQIPPAIARKLGFYVYLYVNPIDKAIFYAGKGKGGRALAHLDADAKEAITKIIRRIRRSESEPQIEILAHKLPNPEATLRLEASAIDLLGLKNLANKVHGHGTKFGRMPLSEVVAHYTQRKANIREPAILIRIQACALSGCRWCFTRL